MYDEVYKFFTGERRYITATVFPENKGEAVVASDAEFELIEAVSREVIQKGKCEIKGNDTARVFLDLTDVAEGNYELRVTMEAMPEKIKSAQKIEVIR